MDVSGANSRITNLKRLCEPPDVRKVDAEHQSGFAIICVVRVRGADVPLRNLGTGFVGPKLFYFHCLMGKEFPCLIRHLSSQFDAVDDDQGTDCFWTSG